MLKKRKITITLLILVIFGIFLGLYFSKKRIDYFYNFNSKNVTKIQIMSGKTGEIKVVDVGIQMGKVMDYLDTLSFRRKITLPLIGWSYNITMFYGERELLKITFINNSNCEIDGAYYNINSETNDDIYELCKSLMKDQ